jgi:hypothetical protein
MLRHAHFDMKGGKQTFAALCTKVRCAGQIELSLQSPECRLFYY